MGFVGLGGAYRSGLHARVFRLSALGTLNTFARDCGGDMVCWLSVPIVAVAAGVGRLLVPFRDCGVIVYVCQAEDVVVVGVFAQILEYAIDPGLITHHTTPQP